MKDFEPNELEGMTRKQIQALCKQRSIRANMKTVDMVAALKEWYDENVAGDVDESMEDASVEAEADAPVEAPVEASAETPAGGDTDMADSEEVEAAVVGVEADVEMTAVTETEPVKEAAPTAALTAAPTAATAATETSENVDLSNVLTDVVAELTAKIGAPQASGLSQESESPSDTAMGEATGTDTELVDALFGGSTTTTAAAAASGSDSTKDAILAELDAKMKRRTEVQEQRGKKAQLKAKDRLGNKNRGRLVDSQNSRFTASHNKQLKKMESIADYHKRIQKRKSASATVAAASSGGAKTARPTGSRASTKPAGTGSRKALSKSVGASTTAARSRPTTSASNSSSSSGGGGGRAGLSKSAKFSTSSSAKANTTTPSTTAVSSAYHKPTAKGVKDATTSSLPTMRFGGKTAAAAEPTKKRKTFDLAASLAKGTKKYPMRTFGTDVSNTQATKIPAPRQTVKAQKFTPPSKSATVKKSAHASHKKRKGTIAAARAIQV